MPSAYSPSPQKASNINIVNEIFTSNNIDFSGYVANAYLEGLLSNIIQYSNLSNFTGNIYLYNGNIYLSNVSDIFIGDYGNLKEYVKIVTPNLENYAGNIVVSGETTLANLIVQNNISLANAIEFTGKVSQLENDSGYLVVGDNTLVKNYDPEAVVSNLFTENQISNDTVYAKRIVLGNLVLQETQTGGKSGFQVFQDALGGFDTIMSGAGLLMGTAGLLSSLFSPAADGTMALADEVQDQMTQKLTDQLGNSEQTSIFVDWLNVRRRPIGAYYTGTGLVETGLSHNLLMEGSVCKKTSGIDVDGNNNVLLNNSSYDKIILNVGTELLDVKDVKSGNVKTDDISALTGGDVNINSDVTIQGNIYAQQELTTTKSIYSLKDISATNNVTGNNLNVNYISSDFVGKGNVILQRNLGVFGDVSANLVFSSYDIIAGENLLSNNLVVDNDIWLAGNIYQNGYKYLTSNVRGLNCLANINLSADLNIGNSNLKTYIQNVTPNLEIITSNVIVTGELTTLGNLYVPNGFILVDKIITNESELLLDANLRFTDGHYLLLDPTNLIVEGDTDLHSNVVVRGNLFHGQVQIISGNNQYTSLFSNSANISQLLLNGTDITNLIAASNVGYVAFNSIANLETLNVKDIHLPVDTFRGIGWGSNVAIAYAYQNGNWFSNTNSGDIVIRNMGGNVVFGTGFQNAQLIISNTSVAIQNTKIGDCGMGSAYSFFAHSSQYTSTNYALLQSSSGDTALNCVTGKKIKFRQNNTDVALLDSSGMILYAPLTLTNTTNFTGKTSQLTNDAGFLTSVSSTYVSNNASYNAKLGDVTATSISLPSASTFTGNYSQLAGKPTNLSSFTNDSGYITSSSLSPYLTSATASSTYLTQTSASSTYLTQTNASSTYLTQSSAASTYLTQTNAASTYQPIGSYITSAATFSSTHPVNAWNSTSDGINRFFFANNGQSYYKSGSFHIFRNSADQEIFTIDTNGVVYINGQNSSGGLNINCSGTNNYLNLDTDANSQTAIALKSGGNNPIILYRPGGSNDFRIYTSTHGDSLCVQNSTGYVGINTNSPSYTLDVNGTGRFTGTLISNGEIQSTNNNSYRIVAGSYGTFFRNDGSGLYLLKTASGDAFGSYDSSRPFSLNFASNNLTLCGDTGNLGIGTYSPQYKLDVSGTMRVSNSGSSYSVLGYFYQPSLGTGQGASIYLGMSASQYDTGFIGFQNAGGSGSSSNYLKIGLYGSTQLSISSKGLGINTTTPSSTLDVAGNVRIVDSRTTSQYDSLQIICPNLSTYYNAGISIGKSPTLGNAAVFCFQNQGDINENYLQQSLYYGDAYTNVYKSKITLGVSGIPNSKIEIHSSNVSLTTANTFVNGNLGIKTAGATLHLNSTSSTNANAQILFSTYDGEPKPACAIQIQDDNGYSGNMIFSTKAKGSASNSLVPQMEITSGGDIKHYGNTRFYGLQNIVYGDLTSDYLEISSGKTATYNGKYIDASNTTVGSKSAVWSLYTYYNICTPGILLTSDQRLKENIQDIDGRTSLDMLEKIQVRKFDYIDKAQGTNKIGVIAQEIEQICPDFVSVGKDEMKIVDYQSLYAMSLSAIQELNRVVKELQSEIKYLKKYSFTL